jgi:hypothetical protein
MGYYVENLETCNLKLETWSILNSWLPYKNNGNHFHDSSLPAGVYPVLDAGQG